MEKEFLNKDQIKQEIKQEIKEFKKFALKEDTIKIAIAVIIGGSINKMANSISNDILSPIINLLVYSPNNFWSKMALNLNKDTKIEVGNLISSFLEFVIVSVFVYVVYIKLIKNLVKNENVINNKNKNCPQCFSSINILAKRCPFCTTRL
jgi:large conductance mechanosensitive channel